MSITSEWNVKQKQLKEIIRKPERYPDAQELFLNMHQSVHFAEMSKCEESLMDQLWDGLEQNEFAIMPTEKDVTIAWDIWHITRIEDLTMNLLVNESEQVLNSRWLSRLHTQVTDTGNAMTDDEIMEFSKSIDPVILKEYRIAVGAKTQEILKNLKAEDMKRKIKREDLARIRDVQGVTEHPESIWLLDFWGKKDVAGIILMPITRHQLVHINEGSHIKEAIRRKNVFYRI